MMLKYRMGFITAWDGGAGGEGDAEGDKQGGEKDSDKAPDLAKMDAGQLRDLASNALETKRAANAEAKTYRLKAEALQAEKDEAAKKASDAEKTTADKLAEANNQIELMKVQNKSMELKQKATTELLEDGFLAKIVDLGVKDLTEDNFTDKVKAFKKEFGDYKLDPSKRPDHTVHRQKLDGNPRYAATHSKAQAAMDELINHGK